MYVELAWLLQTAPEGSLRSHGLLLQSLFLVEALVLLLAQKTEEWLAAAECDTVA